ncbi:unnamed protein product [Effrenium voratum]|nr:unnamed protein product [Effrenium voratum]
MPPSSRCPTESKVPGRLQCPRSWYMPRQESSESDMDSPGIRPKKVRVPEWVVEGCRSYPMERCTTAPAWYPRTGASSAREVCFDEEVQVESEAQLQRRLQQAEKESGTWQKRRSPRLRRLPDTGASTSPRRPCAWAAPGPSSGTPNRPPMAR